MTSHECMVTGSSQVGQSECPVRGVGVYRVIVSSTGG